MLVWMVLGWLLRLDPYQYLAVGIPLTYLFQVVVRRQPLTSLWVRASKAFRLDGWGILLVLVLLALPATLLLPGLRAGGWSRRLWILFAMAGSVPAAFSLRNLDRSTQKTLWRCLIVTGSIGCVVLSIVARTEHLKLSFVPGDVLPFLENVGSLFSVSFLVEEVAFRGAIDAHVHPEPGGPGTWRSALVVSCWWGLWHLPIRASR